MVKLGCFSQLNRYWYRSQNAEKNHWFTFLQKLCFVSFLNTTGWWVPRGGSLSLLSIHHPPVFCVFSKYTSCCRQLNQPVSLLSIHHLTETMFYVFSKYPSARPQYQGSTLFNVYHTEESPIDFLFFFN